MSDPVIPFGYKRITGQLQRGDGIYDYASGVFAKAKRVPTEVIVRKTKMLYPCAMPDGIFAIRKCEVIQAEIPGTEPAEKCSVCGGNEPCSHDFDKIAWPVQPSEQGVNLDE